MFILPPKVKKQIRAAERVVDELVPGMEPGMSLAEAEELIEAQGITDSSAALSRLRYRVAWDGLSGGVLRERE